MPVLDFTDVTFAHAGAGTVLVEGLTARFTDGWTGVVGPNGAGKTTLLALATGGLAPGHGRIAGAPRRILCGQRTDEPPPDLPSFLAADDAVAYRLRGRLGLEPDWETRWSTLSHGERKRAQIGVALWSAPDVLALDEPTNHVDADARRLLLDALPSFRGVGLIVSHDRGVLDALCRQCVFVEPGRITVRPGGYTDARGQLDAERDAAVRQREQTRRAQRKLQRAVQDRAQEAARADRKRSKRGLARRDHDARARIDAARVSGKDGQAGRLADQLAGRLRQVDAKLAAVDATDARRLGVSMRGVPARRDVLVRLVDQTLTLAPTRTLHMPELIVRRDDRIGITGPNGAGKTTLVNRLLDTLDLPPERVVHLAQEIPADATPALLCALHALPAERRGQVLATVACLGSEPDRLLETDAPSPGEARKLTLALGLAREPHLVVMDEPTNHLDLPSIECLEEALADCAAALVLVSHDERFLGRLTSTRWVVGEGEVSVCQPNE
jgi:ATPase subunit of ABC transporter with duplicated ATPase domains